VPAPLASIAVKNSNFSENRNVQDIYSKVEGEGCRLDVIKLPQVKKGFVLLPRRWVIQRSFGWAARLRRLARDYKRLPEILTGLHFLAFAILMTKRVVETMLIAQNS
jgi:hypothetical protein